MGRSRYKIVDDELPHFVTLTVLHWIPVFARPATVSILLDSLKHLTDEGYKNIRLCVFGESPAFSGSKQAIKPRLGTL